MTKNKYTNLLLQTLGCFISAAGIYSFAVAAEVPVAGVAGTRHLPAQAVVLRLPPLLVTILAGKFRIQPFQRRFGLKRVFWVPRTSCEGNARQKHPQEAGSGGKGSQHHGFGFCVRQK